MKNTGMSRKLDDLGRIVIPAEIRKSLALEVGGVLDISVEDNRIILTSRQDSCVFCGTKTDLSEFKERMICVACCDALGGVGPRQSSWEPFSPG
ncbi:MAG: AbrB/MazE/SpoVT family DNA-binding domain-containing protein [Actinomycetota bacterium]|nr:AbrB/MazE/SpoVT family DNA-binding domain-containing protein [Actinomycetota bacterium]